MRFLSAPAINWSSSGSNRLTMQSQPSLRAQPHQDPRANHDGGDRSDFKRWKGTLLSRPKGRECTLSCKLLVDVDLRKTCCSSHSVGNRSAVGRFLPWRLIRESP